MSSIGSGYYTLSNYLSGNSSGGASGASTSASSALQALEQALTASGAQSKSADAYLLNLSPAAQHLLSSGKTAASGTDESSTQFTLNATQQATIKGIIAKYKDSPFTQATFDSIQGDLQKAGLSPQALAAKDQVSSFNATSKFLDALNGNYTGAQTPNATQSDENTKKSNYLQSIASEWKSQSVTSKTIAAGIGAQ